MTEPRIDWHLWNWGRWMHGGKSGHLQMPKKAHAGVPDHTDSQSMVEEADNRCAAATDAAIDDLDQPERVAIYAKHLETTWPLSPAALVPYYRAAVTAIGRGLDRRGIV